MTRLNRRRFLARTAVAGGAAALSSLPVSAASADLAAGAARRDITPENGGEFFGYVRPDMRADGVSTRLFAHALVLDDGERKVALVSVDLGSPMVKTAVVEQVRSLGFDRHSVLLAATHTHCGPLFAGDWIASQVADAITTADEERRPAAAGWGTTDVYDVNRSRSVGAHLANHGTDGVTPGSGSPKADTMGAEHTRNTTLRVLRVEETDGTPIAAWSQFSVHPTTYPNDTTTFSADLAGAATRRFVAGFPGADEDDPGGEGDAPLTMFTNGSVGDLIPIYDDYNKHALADSAGRRLADGMRTAWEQAGDSLSRRLPVEGRAETRRYEGQEVEPGKRVSPVALWGTPFLGGAENGPSPFFTFGMQGKRRPAALADPVQGRKVVAGPAPYSPAVEVQVLRVGDRLLLGAPGEPTTQMGREMRRAAADAGPDDVTDVSVVGIANGYNGYFTTPAEYDQQYYEGGHTVFGKYTSLLVRNAHAEIAGDVAADESGGSGDSGGGYGQGSLPTSEPAPVGQVAPSGELTAQPADAVERMETVTLAWQGGPLGRDRPVGEPFVTLERQDADGWAAAASDLGLGFVWREEPLGSGQYSVRYDVPPDLPTGSYRLRIRSPGYDLRSREFEVQPSTGLRPRGLTHESLGDGAARLTLVAQNPEPDPERNLRTRDVQPTGGTATLVVDGREVEAEWDPDADGWVATVAGVEEGDKVTLPAGGLVDGIGNRSGDESVLTVGEVVDVEWPPNMAVGGGKAPGPFGVGTVPP